MLSDTQVSKSLSGLTEKRLRIPVFLLCGIAAFTVFHKQPFFADLAETPF